MLKTQCGNTLNKWPSLSAGAVVCAMVAVALSGCGDRGGDAKASQSLVSVNGKEITVHQLNEELARANVQAAQKDEASKQILNALIDRQLLEQAALKAKVDRDPNVMQAVERAKAQIVAQAYLQSRLANISKPGKAEIEAYYKENPAVFSGRKMVEMEQLLIESRFVNDDFKAALGGFKTLQEVAAWLDAKGIQYDRGEVSRSIAELPPQISERLKDARKGQLFVIGMGSRTMLVLMDAIKESPVSLSDAMPQIEQALLNKKRKEAGEAEIKQLREQAKIEYLSPDAGGNPGAQKGADNSQASANQKSSSGKSDDIASGIKGLK